VVSYDGTVGGKSDARVVSLDIEFDAADEPPRAASELLARLRRAAPGPDLIGRSPDEATSWIDRDCTVRVETSRRAPDWWAPTDEARYHVRIESIDPSGDALVGRDRRGAGTPD
ncbi:MAG TPA: hypothetical protein VD788_00735, partial [Candidatus Polarisedimenticolaceae bacterium]|nr:hypothetical protein [Candidatus Polarisedimenticolaceae bacterium]